MARIEKYLGTDERIVFQARYGTARALAEIFTFAIVTLIGVAFGPGLLLVWLVYVAWVYGERKKRRIVVTNKRLIHKKPWGSSDFEEIYLDKIESVKERGSSLVIRGTGATLIKLPPFLKDPAGLRRALVT